MITSSALEAQHAAALAVVAAGHAALGQRGVQVDHVRHHGRADDADREVERAAAAQAGQEAAQRAVRRRADAQRLIQEAGEDDPEQRGDRQLEAAEAVRLQLEDRERDHAGDQAGGEQRHAEEQVQPERGAEELGDVGRHRHDLGLHPHAPGERAREALAHDLGIVAVGDDPELGREVLDQHRHHVRQQHDPQQQVAELRAAFDVRGEVARVDVGDRGDERRAEHRERRAHATLGQKLLERARSRERPAELARQRDRGALGGALERGDRIGAQRCQR